MVSKYELYTETILRPLGSGHIEVVEEELLRGYFVVSSGNVMDEVTGKSIDEQGKEPSMKFSRLEADTQTHLIRLGNSPFVVGQNMEGGLIVRLFKNR